MTNRESIDLNQQRIWDQHLKESYNNDPRVWLSETIKREGIEFPATVTDLIARRINK